MLGATGIVLGAAYMLWLYQRTMFGKVDNPENQGLKDLNVREVMTLLPLVVLAFWIGLYPAPFFRILEKPVQKIVAQVERPRPEAARVVPPPGPAVPAVALGGAGGR